MWPGPTRVAREVARTSSCSTLLTGRGAVAVVGRSGSHRLWDLARALVPENVESVPWRRSAAADRRAALACARRPLRERRIGTCIRMQRTGRCRTGHVPVAVRPADPRPRPHGGAVRLLLPPRDVRPESEAGVRLLRPAAPRRRSPRRRTSRRSTGRPASCASTRCTGKPASNRYRCRSPCASLARFVGAGSNSSNSGLRDSRDSRRSGAGSRHRRGDGSDLPDVDVRPGGRRRAQGLRLRACREPDPHGAAALPGVARVGGARRSPSRPASARSTTIMHLVSPGDRVVAVNDVYGGVYRMFSQVYEPKGYEFTWLPAAEISERLADALDERTRIVWLETSDESTAERDRHPRRRRGCARGRRDGRRRQHVRDAVPAAPARARRRHRPTLDDEVPRRPLGRRRRLRGDERSDRRGASALPAEIARRRPGSVRLLARSARGQDARGAHAPALRERSGSSPSGSRATRASSRCCTRGSRPIRVTRSPRDRCATSAE